MSGVAEDFDLRDPVAERMIVGAALHGRTAELAELPVEAITHPQLATVAMVIRSMVARGIPVTAGAVMRTVLAEAAGRNNAEAMGRVVADCVTGAPHAASAPYYAERLHRLATARGVSTALDLARRNIHYAAYNDDDEGIAGAFTKARAVIDASSEEFTSDVEEPMTLAELLDSTDEEYDWLIPGLLERSDRLILTGGEGAGKSFLSGQVALGVGGEIHPFTTEPLPNAGADGYRVLIFDCENSKRQMRRRYRRIAGQINEIRQRHGLPPMDWKTSVRLISRPEGVDLSSPRELAKVEQAVATVSPDLLVCGPIYKMSKMNLAEEQAAQELTIILDGIRVRHGCALLIEGHAGHAKTGEGSRAIRPIGSSLFLRWPEFGYGIRAAEGCEHEEHPSLVDVVSWRGSREERQWPQQLQHGSTLPWVPTPEYWDQVATPTGRVR